MPYLTIHGRLGRASLFGEIPLGIAIWYTIKIFRMDDQELLRSALDPVLALSDIRSSFSLLSWLCIDAESRATSPLRKDTAA